MTEQTSATTETTDNSADNSQATKTFTQDEVNALMARTKSQLEKKFANKYDDLGDPDELRDIVQQHRKNKEDYALKRGEFEKTLQDLAQKKDAEIAKRDNVIKEYKVNTPLLNAAAQYRSVNPEQVRNLLSSNVRLNADGEVEVIDAKGAVRYNDAGEPLGVNDLVREFLDYNPHFVQPTPATTNTQSSFSAKTQTNAIDISKLDMRNPEHRKQYAEYRKANGLA